MYLASWSGGKDGCLACYRALARGIPVSCLLNTISEEYRRVRFHGTEARLIQLQAESIGLPLQQISTTADGYERQFNDAVRRLRPDGMVFGDIWLEEGRKWVEKVCDRLGIEPLFPLWGESPGAILDEFLDLGFRAVVVSARADLFGAEWIGHPVDRTFVRHLVEKDIDPCGEGGEYHTLVTGGPMFSRPIRLIRTRPILRPGPDGTAYRFLDTVAYGL